MDSSTGNLSPFGISIGWVTEVGRDSPSRRPPASAGCGAGRSRALAETLPATLPAGCSPLAGAMELSCQTLRTTYQAKEAVRTGRPGGCASPSLWRWLRRGTSAHARGSVAQCAGAWGRRGRHGGRGGAGRVRGGPGLEALGVIGVTAVPPLLKGEGFPTPPLLVSLPLAGAKGFLSCPPLRAGPPPLLPTAPVSRMVVAGDTAKGTSPCSVFPQLPSPQVRAVHSRRAHPTGGSSSRKPRRSRILLHFCNLFFCFHLLVKFSWSKIDYRAALQD